MLTVYQRQLNLRLYHLFYTGEIDGIEGNKTKDAYKKFQKYEGLVVDGIYGNKTNEKLKEVIKNIQSKLNEKGYNLNIDGLVGDKTINAVKDFQKNNNLDADGIVGDKTIKALYNLNDKFRYPLNYIAITTFYSNRHKGVDFGWNNIYGKNIDITSISDGIVIENSYNSSCGNYVIIKHNNNFKSRYLHLKARSNKKVNERVYKGDKIGNMGTTGDSNGNHLHLDLYKNNNRVNPIDYLYVYENQIVCEEDKNKVKYI